MRNRFLEKRAYLDGTTDGARAHSRSTATRRRYYSSAQSANQRALVVLIENGGVDLGIPDLLDRVLGSIGGLIPESARDALVRRVEQGILQATDNLLESAELALNRYRQAAPEHYGQVEVLRNGTALYQSLKNKLIQLSQDDKIIDLIVLTHGSSNYIALAGGQGITAQMIRDLRTVHNANRPLHLRSVYMMNCVGSSLNQAWIDAGAKCSAGSLRNNYLPEPTTYFYFRNWKSGMSFNDSVINAYRSTIESINSIIRGAGDAVLPFGLGGQLAEALADLESRDFIRDSAPVVSGDGTTTIASDALSFGSSLSTSFTIVPLGRHSRAFQDEPSERRASARLVEFLKSFEAFESDLYDDPAGHCTIGYGTLVHRGRCNGAESERPYQDGISEERATELLRERLAGFEHTVNDAVEVPLNQHQFDALCSFAYNVGSGAFRGSTLLRRLNRRDYEAVSGELARWNKANGRVLPGLVRRRAAEGRMFTAGDYSTRAAQQTRAMQETESAPAGAGISRIWLWAGGRIPSGPLTNPNDAWWSRREELGMTDFVISLNDHGFPGGRLNLNPTYRGSTRDEWAPLATALDAFSQKGIAPHLMVFLRPEPTMIRDAAQALQAIIARTQSTPRSIQLDLEGWWGRRPQAERLRGEEALTQHFFESWSGPRPELGVGITHVARDGHTIHALSRVDFAVPQMYASEGNYGRPLNSNLVTRDHARAAEALGPNKQVIVGQTANDNYVTPQVMRDMLAKVLDLSHPHTGSVREVAYWSDLHVLNNPGIKAYFQSLTRALHGGPITAANLPASSSGAAARPQWVAAHA